VFFDLETTGLSGGAGTLAFLVGCGWFDDDGAFVTRQFLLARYADERMLLEAVAAELGAPARSSASTASRSTRRCSKPLPVSPPVVERPRDAAPRRAASARRFWKRKAHTLSDENSCSLVALEKQLVGTRRRGDVPGSRFPAGTFSSCAAATRRRSGRARAQPPGSPDARRAHRAAAASHAQRSGCD
jgi:hypothetical protein